MNHVVKQSLLLREVCGALHDLVPFAQFKKREKHPWRSVNFRLKLTLLHACFSCLLNCTIGTKSRNASYMEVCILNTYSGKQVSSGHTSGKSDSDRINSTISANKKKGDTLHEILIISKCKSRFERKISFYKC